jgi:hypothetical protein
LADVLVSGDADGKKLMASESTVCSKSIKHSGSLGFRLLGISMRSARYVVKQRNSSARGILIRLNAKLTFSQVFNGDPNYTCTYQKYLPGVMNYPAYYWITQAFESTNGSISNLVNGKSSQQTNLDS